jgi:hypothetical protein
MQSWEVTIRPSPFQMKFRGGGLGRIGSEECCNLTFIAGKKTDYKWWSSTNHKLTKAPPKKGRGETRNKMEWPIFKKTNESLKRMNRKGNIKFLNPFLSQEAYQIRKGEDLLKRVQPKQTLTYSTTHLKIEIIYTRCYNAIDTLCL